MDVSTINVTYAKTGTFSNVFGVLSDTEASDSRAHNRMSRRTHSCRWMENERKEKFSKGEKYLQTCDYWTKRYKSGGYWFPYANNTHHLSV